MEGHAPRAERRELVHGLDRIDWRSGGVTERVAAQPPNRPQPEAELVVFRRLHLHRKSLQ